jgi:hypothetical protein
MMKPLLTASILALAAAGCASTGETYGSDECKVAPITTTSASYTGKARSQPSEIEQRYAEMQLANTPYRREQLARNGYFNNNVEDALRDCQNKP